MSEVLAASDAARLTEFSRAFKAAARAVVLYPDAHPAITATLGRLAQLTSSAQLPRPLRISVTAGSLLVGGQAVARPDAAISELAALLHGHLIGEITIHPDGDASAWRTFLRLIARPPDDVRAEGGVARIWTTMAGRHVEIRQIDYAEVLRERQAGAAASWQEIVATCLAGDRIEIPQELLEALIDGTTTSEELADVLGRFDTPGDGYYRALSFDRTSHDSWFRQTYLHELLHAFGLDHTDDIYAMTNYGNRPWINMGSDTYRDDAVAPLPDDAAGLRHLYPQPGADHAEVALTNTWYDPTDVTNGAAAGDLLCAPSLGTAFKTDLFSVTACATGGPQSGDDEVCAGDTLLTRFTLANYSTESITYTIRLYFSTDLQHSWNDIISPSTSNGWQAREISDLKSVSWEVPAALYATNPPSAIVRMAVNHGVE